MRITFYCPTCQRQSELEGGVTPERGGQGALRVAPQNLPIAQGYVYRYTCEKGHSNETLLRNLKYELMFESAMNTLYDGYYRESVSSFYAALENFYTEIIIYNLHQMNKNALRKSLFEMLGQNYHSERKLGMFHSIFLARTGGHIKNFASAKVNFRNEVIHGNKYPSKFETIDFGMAVYNFIIQVLEEIQKFDPDYQTNLLESVLWYTDESDYHDFHKPSNYYGFYLSYLRRPQLKADSHDAFESYIPFWQHYK